MLALTALCQGYIARGQDFIDLAMNPGHISQYDIAGAIEAINAQEISYYIQNESNLRLASVEEAEKVNLLTQTNTFLQNVQLEKITLENLEQYYFPILVALMEKMYDTSTLLKSLSNGRKPLFGELRKEVAAVEGWEKYLMYQEFRELLQMVAGFAGNTNSLDDKELTRSKDGKEAIKTAGGTLHYIEYKLFGSDKVMSRLDPYPETVIRSVFPENYRQYWNKDYLGGTIYKLINDAGDTGSLQNMLSKREDIVFLMDYLPQQYLSTIGNYSEILFPERDVEVMKDVFATAYSRRAGVDKARAISFINFSLLLANTDYEDFSKKEDDPFNKLRDSLFLAGYDFTEDYPYANAAQYKGDSLFHQYDISFFERIITDLKTQANRGGDQQTKEMIRQYLVSRYGFQDIQQVLSLMIEEVCRISETENNPLAINGMINLAQLAVRFDYTDIWITALFQRLLLTDINTAKYLFNTQISKCYQFLQRVIGEYPEARAAYAMLNAQLAHTLSEHQYLGLVDDNQLAGITDTALGAIDDLEDDNFLQYARLLIAYALIVQERYEEARSLLECAAEAPIDDLEPLYAYDKVFLATETYEWEGSIDYAKRLVSEYINDISADEVYRVFLLAAKCEDVAVMKECRKWLVSHPDVLDNLIWCDAYTREKLYSKFRQEVGRMLKYSSWSYSFWTIEMKDLFADVIYNFALTTKGFLLKSDHRVLQNILNNSDSRVTEMFDYKSTAGKVMESAGDQMRENLITAISRRDANAFNIHSSNNEDVRRWLSAGEVAVEFLCYTTYSSYACAVIERPEYEHAKYVDIDLGEFTDKYGSISNPDIYYDKKVMKALSDCIWGPVKQYLKEGDTVYYSMDREMNFINSEALPYDVNRNLGAVYKMRRVSTTENKPEDLYIKDVGTATLFGGISVKGEDNISESTRREIKEIAARMRSAGKTIRQYTGKAASKATMRALGGSAPDILHISTHGYLDQYAYGSSLTQYGLFMSDGVFTAEDVAKLDLSHIRAVFLSACDSGGGIVGEDGVFGLQRGFKQAGAGAIVMALWPVEAAFTEKLMICIYAHFCEGYSLRDAFEMAVAESRSWCDSSDWAAFVMLD